MEPKIGILANRFTDAAWAAFTAEEKGLLSLDQAGVDLLYVKETAKNDLGQDVPILVPTIAGKRRETLIDRPAVKPTGAPPTDSYRPATAREAHDLNMVGAVKSTIAQQEATLEQQKMILEDLKADLIRREAVALPLGGQLHKNRWYVKI